MVSSLGQWAAAASLLLAIATVMIPGGVTQAQEEAAEGADAPAEAEVPAEGAMGFPAEEVPLQLQENFQQMVHYYRIARLDLAADFAERVLAADPEPTVLLQLVEHPDAGEALLFEMAAADSPELADAAQKLITISDRGVIIKRKDGTRILAQLHRIGKNERAYQLGLRELKYSGEYVVPYALGLLAAEDEADLYDDIKRALLAIDRPGVYPLVVALQTPDDTLKLEVIDLLGDLGYKMALPGLKALVESPEASDPVKDAAREAIVKIGGEQVLSTSAKRLYYDLAESLYYDRISVVKDADRAVTDVWGWVPGSGLGYKAAPTRIVNEIMAARAAQHGLGCDPDALELVSLWLSIQMQMKADLVALGRDAADPWAPDAMPTTEFWGRAVGQQYLLDVLDRALEDDNVMVALQAIRALDDVANQSFLAAAGSEGSPLVRALAYPDRMVRFWSAFAIVSMEPKKPFLGSDRVTPVLAEAVNLETGPGVLIIDADQDRLNRLKGAFRRQGWNVGDATNGNEGVSEARGMARIDAVLLGVNVENVGYTEVIQLLRTDFSTALVPIVLLGGEAERVPFSFLQENVKYIAQVPGDAALGAVLEKINELQAEAGLLALEPEASKGISLRAAEALRFVATADLAFDARAARASLLSAAAGQNGELAQAAMQALVQMPDEEVQQHLAGIALDEDTEKEIQIAALDAVAQVARHIGNRLQTASVTALVKRVGTESDDDIRDAIGTVLGALDLEPEMASEFILEHAAE